jgi:hypothetical protein
MSKAKTMSRSRNQLATAYAPESFFTFEGGLGACIAHSAVGESPGLSEATVDQIFERINELGRAWFDAAMKARDHDPSQPPVMPAQCVDRSLLDASRTFFKLPGQDSVFLCRPSHMEYTPAPLAFVCRTCDLFRDFSCLKDLDRSLSQLSPDSCQHPKKRGECDWEQLDVIFVHWSGRWSPAFPGQYQWNDRDGVVQLRDTCVCNSRDFLLNRRQAGIGDWFFECAACGKPLSPKWLQNDPDTMQMIGSAMSPDRLTEVRMQATPYRASSAYYVKSDLFIDFKDAGHDLLGRLRPGRQDELQDFIAKRYGFPTVTITDDDVVTACKDRDDCKTDLADYQTAVSRIRAAEGLVSMLAEGQREAVRGLLNEAHDNRRRIVDGLRQRGIVLPRVDLPPELTRRLTSRQQFFAPKFDPFRLAVEHAVLDSTRLTVERKDRGKKPYVSFTRLDDDLGAEDLEEREVDQNRNRDLLRDLGVADMGLIREFELCRFSFGYSRMEAGPVLRDKRNMDMPVRLRLFPPVRPDGVVKHPIYVVQQANEALYVRLDHDHVLKWLTAQHCEDMFTLSAAQRLGAGLLECAHPMGSFLDRLPQSEKPPTYLYLYTLLHSYSHLVIKHISEYSGLDLGSLGEYIFPADLAFVVYRNGTTMDLGNLSAMWRNVGTSVLTAMLQSKATQCGTGSLCTQRGGACPDCLMIPETSCVASNKLLSRAVLRGIGGRPRFDTRDEFLTPGYLDIVGLNNS